MLLVSNMEPEAIRALIAPDAVTADLQVGDFMDTDTGLLIERKAVPDLLASLGDGRLFDQAMRMVSVSETPVILIHGSLLPDKDNNVVANGATTRWSYWSVMMALVSVQLGGVAVVIVPDRCLEETVEKLRAWARKPQHRLNSKPRGMWLKPARDIEVMSLIAGGLTRAQAIIDKYSSVINAVVNINSWGSIDGVGKKTIENAKEILGISDSVVIPMLDAIHTRHIGHAKHAGRAKRAGHPK